MDHCFIVEMLQAVMMANSPRASAIIPRTWFVVPGLKLVSVVPPNTVTAPPIVWRIC